MSAALYPSPPLQPAIPPHSYQLYTPGQRFEGWKVVGPAGSNVALIIGDFMQNGFLFDAQSGSHPASDTSNALDSISLVRG